MKRQWTENQKKEIINLYCEQGLSCEVIGKKYGAKGTTISKYLKEWNIQINQRDVLKIDF